MQTFNEELNYEELKKSGTGGEQEEKYRIVTYPFSHYLIKIKVSPRNEFLGIAEIQLNRDFMDYKQKAVLYGTHEVDKFYQD